MKLVKIQYILLFLILGAYCNAQDLTDKNLALSERTITPGNDSCVLFLIRENKFYASTVKLGVEIGNHYFVILPNKSFTSIKVPGGIIELYAHFLWDLNYQLAYCDPDRESENFTFDSTVLEELPDYLTKDGKAYLKLFRFSVLDLGLDECKKAVQIFSDKKGMVECTGIIKYKNAFWNQNDTARSQFLIREPQFYYYYHPGIVPIYFKSTHLKKSFKSNFESGKTYYINIEPKISELVIEDMDSTKATKIINKLPAASYKFHSKKPYNKKLFDFMNN